MKADSTESTIPVLKKTRTKEIKQEKPEEHFA